MKWQYVTVDVFTRNQFGGNQLAVLTDARGLTDAQMQRIANEFNYSETTFVLPPRDPANSAHVRIFNRSQEMPFAGHPNVGTAYVLGAQEQLFGRPVGPVMRFEEAAGIVTVEVTRENGAPTGATIAAPQSLIVGRSISVAGIARCLGLDEADIVLKHHPPVVVSVGVEFVVVEVAAPALPRATPHKDAFGALAREQYGAGYTGRFSVFFYSRAAGGIGELNARMFAPLSGTFEDPATGSAAAALGAFLAQLEVSADGEFTLAITQGVVMGRPSEIAVKVTKSNGRVESVTVSGRCVRVMEGALELTGNS